MGCFHQVHEGWVNTDITPNILISRIPFSAKILHSLGVMNDEHYEMHSKGIFKQVKYMNICKPLPYGDNTVECMFCSHVLEHLYPHQVKHLLTEALRVLTPGGIFRVSVPSLEWVVSLYDKEDPYRFLNYMYELDFKRPKNSHKWMYNDQSLARLFNEHGFQKVNKCEYQQGLLPDVEKMDSRPNESIFVEACKPSA